ncbi:ABC transporter permease [Devosia sp. SL43]|uniref:ABC transporter permease n=1 Tax=Devosia sp. SL43 TaxID=2806348 RepID=UPI001F1F405F|nr:ABC-2 family transporter protein [Devosia sp. SL43]UJW86848.1 ABC-2 family transporter protein [Devosia sp. SL43]
MARLHIVIPALVRTFIRSKAEYPGAMVLGWLSQFAAYASMYTAISLILARFGSLGGWLWPEMALLLSFHLLGYSLGASLSFVQFREIEDKVRMGTFDAILVKPIGPWTYLVFSGLNIGYTGHIVLAIGLMAWSLTQVDVTWTPLLALLFLAYLTSAAMIVAAVMTMIGATALVWVKSNHLYQIFFGFWELARYPLNIFPLPLQVLMLTVAPLAFLAYVPVAALLGKPVPLIGDWAAPAALLMGPLCVLIAMAHWRWCLRNYQGAGG